MSAMSTFISAEKLMLSWVLTSCHSIPANTNPLLTSCLFLDVLFKDALIHCGYMTLVICERMDEYCVLVEDIGKENGNYHEKDLS